MRIVGGIVADISRWDFFLALKGHFAMMTHASKYILNIDRNVLSWFG
jgi:hypothetical protein